jgi:hypothetical protein
VDDQTLDIGRGRLGKVKVDSILPEWISTMQVFKGDNAIAKYGEKGKDGVIIITIKDMALLPKEIQDAFKAAKKE